MKSYRRLLYKFAGKIDDEEDDDIVIPEYKSISDTTHDVIRPVMLNQQAIQYNSNKTIEDERDRAYAYKQPLINNFVAVRPTSAREEIVRKRIMEQAIKDNDVKYRASLPRYMITDRPGLNRPFIGLEDVLLLGGKTLLEKTGRSLYNLAARKTTEKGVTRLATIPSYYMNKQSVNQYQNLITKTENGVTKSVTVKTGKVKVNKKDMPEYNYNITRYPVMDNPNNPAENAASFLYYHPRNRLQIDIESLKRSGWKTDGDKLLSKTVNQDIDNDINILIKDLNTEYRRIINWNKSPYRIWNNEADRQLYLNNLENVKRNATINITDLSKMKYHGYYTNPTHNIFLNYQDKPELLSAYRHEFGGHAADIFDTLNPIKSGLLKDVRDNYKSFISKGAKQHVLNTNEGKMEIALRKNIDELLKNYKTNTLKDPDLIREARDLNEYLLKPSEIVARLEELRYTIWKNKIKLNGKQFKPSTVIEDKEFSELSKLTVYNEAGKKVSIWEKYKLDMFTPETIKDLMNKVPTTVGIGTAGLAGYNSIQSQK